MATQDEISYHYDVGSDFFEQFLDRNHRAYSCAVWDNTHSLEEAQTNKLARLAMYAGVKPGARVLDIGCGWGGMMSYAVDTLGARSASGITLSRDQYHFVKLLNRDDLEPLLTSWEDYAPDSPFESLVSIGAFEHFASLKDRFENQHRNVYQRFFEWCRSISTKNAFLGLQSIVTSRQPETREEINDTRYLLKNVFPGSALPSVSDIVAASKDTYEIIELKQIGLHYARTLSAWKIRLSKSEEVVKEKFGGDVYDHYIRYFDAAKRAFERGLVNLVQLSMAPRSAGRNFE